MNTDKPFKGRIYNWKVITFDPTKYEFEQPTLGYVIQGFRHPNQLGSSIRTSAVVNHVGNDIETLNSWYTLVD